MRPPTGQDLIDRRAESLQASDPVGYAALQLRHRGICPVCGGRARQPSENAVTSMRIFKCIDCMWTAQCSETQFRGTADKTLRSICTAALEVKRSRESTRRASRRAARAQQQARRPSSGDESRNPAPDVQSGSVPSARASRKPRSS